MANFFIAEAFRAAGDHEYTKAKVDPNHVIPDSWVYAIPKTIGLVLGLTAALYMFPNEVIRSYLASPKVFESNSLDILKPFMELASFIVYFLVTFQLASGYSFFELVTTKTKMFAWKDPKTKNRFGVTSLLLMSCLLLAHIYAYVLISKDITLGTTRVVPIDRNSWDLNTPKPEKPFLDSTITNTLQQIPLSSLFLPPPKPVGSTVIIKASVQRPGQPTAQATMIGSGCANPRSVIANDWLRAKSSGSAIDAVFHISKSGRLSLIKATSKQDPGVCTTAPRAPQKSSLASLLHQILSEQRYLYDFF